MEMERLKDEDSNAVDDYGTIGRNGDKKPILFDDQFVVSPALYIISSVAHC